MGKWYKQGFADALICICDPPWHPGHRDHTSYMEGHADGERQAAQDAYVDAYESETDKRIADKIDGYDRDDLGESPDY
jgi:hypothetical protein